MQMDDELLQDFLIEACELIDSMDAQLVGLEGAPGDQALLNGIFRTFHTIKGGAGFLGLKPLVSICHHAEEALNLIRAGECRLDAAGVDLILQSVDEVKRMFAEVGDGRSPDPATEELLRSLAALTRAPSIGDAVPQNDHRDDHRGPGLDRLDSSGSGSEDVSEAIETAERPEQPLQSDDVDPDEEDFDALIDAIQGRGPKVTPAHGADAAASSDTQRPADSRGADTSPEAEPLPPPDRRVDERRAPAAESAGGYSLRVEAARVDDVMNLVGELVLVRNRLLALRTRVRDDDLTRTLSRLNLVTSDLQGSVMRLRMQPLSKAFGRFPRVVRDLARQLGKEVVLEMRGETTELDKGMVESLADPLVHLVRNAVDHGIEMPAERASAGKPACGRLTLAAHQEGSHIIITVSDDGGGLDPGVIKQKALERGLVDARAALQLSDADALQLVFAPGFSTKAAVSDISGRGVGLDVVKNQIGRVNGSVDIHSEKGRGTRIVIRLPLTLAILPALMIVVAGQRLALPLPVIEEIIDLEPEDCSTLDGAEVLSLRGEVLPLMDLERWVGADGAAPDGSSEGRPMFAVIADAGSRRVALVVHKLIGQEEVVIKSLGRRLEGLPGFAGATITGDGGIALIVDLGTLYSSWSQLAVHGTARSVA